MESLVLGPGRSRARRYASSSMSPRPAKSSRVRTARLGRAIPSVGFPRMGVAQMTICLRRREFIAGLGGAAAWPLAARAQQQRPIPTIGFLSPGNNSPALSAALSKRLMEVGYVEGRNVKVEYRWTGEINERLGEFAAELVRQQ